MWVFRHFPILPPEVLSRRAQTLVSELFSSRRASGSAFFLDQPVIGTIERIPQPGGSATESAAQTAPAREHVAWSRRGSS
jgi:hypothetical protein